MKKINSILVKTNTTPLDLIRPFPWPEQDKKEATLIQVCGSDAVVFGCNELA